MLLRKLSVAITFLILLLKYGYAQTSTDSSLQSIPIKTSTSPVPYKKSKFVAVPVFYYEPETRFGIGVAGNYKIHFAFDSTEKRASNVQFSVSATQLHQVIIAFPFQLWLNKEKYNIYGETNFYKYNYLFFGIGNSEPKDFKERYSLRFPRIRINALKRIITNLYAGIRYSLDNFHMHKLDTAGELITGKITGGRGGKTSGLGVEIKYDTRDMPYYPTKGSFIELFTQSDSKYTGSNFNFNKFSFDASTYYTLLKQHTFAFNIYTAIIDGNPPFNQMALLGGPKRMRGFYEGRYRDKNAWVAQTEYRVVIYKKLGAVVFSGIGSVSDNLSSYFNRYVRFTYGAGVRYNFDTTQHFNIRFDVGAGNKHLNYYLTIGEAF